jgi:hypothetical protein
LTIAMIVLLYIIAAYLFFTLRDRPAITRGHEPPTIIELLPMPEPPQRLLPATNVKLPPGQAPSTPRASPVRVDTPSLAPMTAQSALPRIDYTPTLKAPPAPAPVEVGGAVVGDIGTGAQGTNGDGIGGPGAGGDGGGARDTAIKADWAREATWAEIYAFHPAGARQARISGYVELRCLATLKRRLKECQVSAESPMGWKFGRAALSLVPQLRVLPRKQNGVEVDNSMVYFKIRFDLPKE